MSKLRQRRSELRENLSLSNDCWAKLKEAYPEIALALLGKPKTATAPAEQPCTLMIWAEGDKLKWSVNCRNERWTAFGCFPDPVLNVEDVESHLKEGKFELKQRA